MELPRPLIRGVLLRRYKRFLADVELPGGEVVTAHCANPGAMLGLTAPGLTAWLSASDNPRRKLHYSLELLEADGTLVGIDTSRPNRIAEEAVRTGAAPELAGYGLVRREVRYGRNSRIDLLLERDGAPPCYVEVKNVHLMRRPGLAEFPDCVTARGAKHLVELADMVAAGARAVMLYVVQRGDCDRFDTAGDLDPAYHEGLREAARAGVEVLCYGCQLTLTDISLARRLPWIGAPA